LKELKDPESMEFEELLSRGIEASRAGEGEEAVAWFKRACAASPRTAMPQLLLGSELCALRRNEEAEAAIASAVLLEPELYVARYQLGLLQFSAGRPAVAIVTWRPLLDLPDTDPLLHYVRGFVAVAQERPGEALAHYREGLACDGNNPSIASDIRRVMDGIEALPATTEGKAAPQGQDNHLLLANYRRHDRLH